MATASTEWTPESGCSEPCPMHRNHVLRFYCPRHNDFACGNCLIENHERCECDYIPDIAANYGNSDEAQSFKKSLDKLNNRIEELTTDSCENVFAAIQDYRTYVDSILHKCKHDLVAETHAIEAREGGPETTIVSDQDGNEPNQDDIIHVQVDVDDDANESIQSNEMKATDGDIEGYLSSVKTIISKQTHKFTRNEGFGNLLQSGFNALGSVKSDGKAITKDRVDTATGHESSISTFDRATQTEVQKEDVKVAKEHCEGATAKVPVRLGEQEVSVFHPDRYSCVLQDGYLTHMGSIKAKISSSIMMDNNIITGLACVAVNKLVIADGDQKCIVLVETNSRIILQFMKLKAKPFDVVSLPNNQVAVSFPFEKKIKLFSIYHPFNRFHFVKAISVSCECYGLSFKSDILVVSMLNPAGIEIMDLNGKIYKRLDPTLNGRKLLQWPYYVTIVDDVRCSNDEDTDVIFVSDKYKRAVFKLSMEGELLCINSNFAGNWKLVPNGICAVGGGHIVVCSSFSGENRISLVSPDGILRKHLIINKDYICGPCAVCYNPKDMRLYATYSTDQPLGNEKCNTISIYDVHGSVHKEVKDGHSTKSVKKL